MQKMNICLWLSIFVFATSLDYHQRTTLSSLKPLQSWWLKWRGKFFKNQKALYSAVITDTNSSCHRMSVTCNQELGVNNIGVGIGPQVRKNKQLRSRIKKKVSSISFSKSLIVDCTHPCGNILSHQNNLHVLMSLHGKAETMDKRKP